MANFDTIKTAIDANIKTNGTQDITGGKMNSILKQMVDATDEQLTELESEIELGDANSEVNSIVRHLGLTDIVSYKKESFAFNNVYIDANGNEIEFSTSQATDYIPVDGVDTFVGFIEQNGDVRSIWYDENKTPIGRAPVIKQSMGQYEQSIPDNAKFIRVVSLYRGGGTAFMPVANPFFKLGKKSVSKEINIGKQNLLDVASISEKPIVFEINGYLTKNGTISENAGFIASGFVDVGINTKLFVRAADYAQAFSMVEYDQNHNVISANSIHITDSNLDVNLTGKVFDLNEQTRYIRVSSLLSNVRYQDVDYYGVNPYAFLFTLRTNKYKEDISVIDQNDFVVRDSFINAIGASLVYYGAEHTDYISIENYDTLNIKRLAAFASMSIAFYSDTNEESFLSSEGAEKISTKNGEVVLTIPANAKYVRISNIFQDITYKEETHYAIKPIIVLGNRFISELEPVSDCYGQSFIGCEKYAMPENYDYSQIVVYGQSLAQGTSSNPISVNNIPNAYMLGESVISRIGQLMPLRATEHEYPVVNAVNALQQLYNRKRKLNPMSFIAYTGGQGGRCIAAISKGRNIYDNFLTGIENTKLAVGNKSVGCVAIVYMQGESDYSPNSQDVDLYTNDKDTYKARLLELKNNLQNDIMSIYGQAEKPLFFVYQTSQLWIRSDSVGGSTNLNLPISMAQRELAEEHEDVILITPVYPVSSYTDEHLSSNGYAWYGEYIAKAIWQTLNKEINFSNTKIKKVVKSGNKIYISCQVPVMPLQIDTYTLPEQKNYGFQVLDGTKEVNILSVSVQSSGIVLTLDADVSKIDDLSVSYAGRYRNGRGNICDSDEWVSAEIYKDDSSDQGDDGDLSIGQRPHDKNGNSLVGKHYPCKNFLGNFYIEL